MLYIKSGHPEVITQSFPHPIPKLHPQHYIRTSSIFILMGLFQIHLFSVNIIQRTPAIVQHFNLDETPKPTSYQDGDGSFPYISWAVTVGQGFAIGYVILHCSPQQPIFIDNNILHLLTESMQSHTLELQRYTFLPAHIFFF